MSAPLYKQFYDQMISQNKKVFEDFKIIHDKYLEDPKTHQAEFNAQGREVQEIVRLYENRLCGKSEGSGYSKYSTNLSEKFQAEVKKDFPKIDYIGIF